MTIYHILAALGMVITSLFAISGLDETYQTGYGHGHADGFRDGIRSIDGVG